MKFLWFALFASVIALHGTEKGSPDVIHWQGDNVEQKVQETGRLEIFPNADSSSSGAMDGYSAARLADPGKRFLWEPTRDRKRGAGGAKIPGAAVSADKSALFLLETVGADSGPFDTRLIILETSGGNIIRVQRFSKVRYEKILTLPDSNDLLLAEYPVQNKQRIVRLDPLSGTIQSITMVPVFSDWQIMGSFLLIKEQENNILRFISNKTLADIQQVKTSGKGGYLLPETEEIINHFSPDNPGKLERIPLPGTAKVQYGENFLALPAGFAPVRGLILEKNSGMLLLLEPEGAAMLRIGKTFYPLAERINGLATYHENSKTLFLGLQKRDMIAEFLPEQSTNQLRTSLTGQLKPMTRGEPRMIFCSDSERPEIMVLDHRANIYRLSPPVKGRTWKKTICFTPGK